MQKYEFKSALAHLHTFHGIYLSTPIFEEYAIHGWDKIGNKRFALYSYIAPTIEHRLTLPCNVDIIEAVTSNTVDYQMRDNLQAWDYSNLETESLIESTKGRESAYYSSGALLTYQEVDGDLVFEADHGAVRVLYKGLLLDEEGFPFLNYKEVEAIANYCAYVETRKKGMISKDKSTIEISQILKAEWERSAAHARTPEYLNQNDWNELLEAKNSWDRKRYNTSFKPVSR